MLGNGATSQRALPRNTACAVLLKGHVSSVTDGSFTVYTASGTPALRRAAAETCCPASPRQSPRAAFLLCGRARGASYLLGQRGSIAAARQGNEYSVTASDVVAALPAAIAQLSRA